LGSCIATLLGTGNCRDLGVVRPDQRQDETPVMGRDRTLSVNIAIETTDVQRSGTRTKRQPDQRCYLHPGFVAAS